MVTVRVIRVRVGVRVKIRVWGGIRVRVKGRANGRVLLPTIQIICPFLQA